MATLKEVYDAFKADGAPLPNTYEEFETYMTSGPNKGYDHRKEWYDAFKADGAPLPDTYEEFSAALFSPKKPAQTPDVTPADKSAEETQAEEVQPTTEQKFRQARRDTEAMFARNREFMDNMTEYYHDKPGLGFRTAKSKPTVNLATGKIENAYLTPTGERTIDKNAADKVSYEFRRSMAAADMSVGAQIRRAQDELDLLSRQRMEKSRQIEQDASATSGGLLSGYNRALLTDARNRSDKELRALDVAIRKKEEQLKTLQDERDRQKGIDVGFWRGFGSVVSDLHTWDMGISDALDASVMLNADKYSAPGASEDEKRAGQEMLKAIYDKEQTEQMYGDNASFWNRAGVMTGYMPSFMLDFALTGGGFEAINAVGKLATQGAAKMIGKEALKEMTELGVKAYAKKYGVRGAGRMAGNWTIKALGTTTDELLIRAPLMTNTAQAGKTAADIIDRKLGDVVIDENGNYDFSNDKTWGSAVWQGEASSIIENYSEMFGTHLDGVVPSLAKTFGGKRISGMLARANKSGFGKILETTRKQFERLGVSDYFGEVSEEYYGQLWRSMLNLDDAYTNVPVLDKDGNQVLDAEGNPVYERKNLLFTGQFHGDIWGGMALSMGLMGAGKYSISGIAYGNMKHQVNKADKRAAEIFTPDRWEPIRELIDNTSNEDMGILAEGMVNDQNLSDDECSAVMEYMERSLNLRGLNLGAMAQSHGEASAEEGIDSELSQSYIDGYEASSPQEMNDAQNMYEYQRLRLVNELGSIGEDNISSILYEVESNPVGALMKTYDANLRDIILDYANAKTVRDGVLQRVNDNIDEQIAQSDAMIDGRVSSATGMIQPATLGLDDREVYVVGGTLAVNEDGTIDRDASDESIVVRDAQTGKLEFTDPKSISSAGEAIDPETEKAMAADSIRQQAAQTAADAMNGTLAFNTGDAVQISNGNGFVQATIAGPAVDEESGMPVEGQIAVQLPDGQQTVFTKEQLQTFADAANLERLNAFEQERATARAQQRQPRFALNDEFTIINAAGAPIRGSVTGELDEDGTVEIYTEEPVNGNRVNRFSPEELGQMLDTYNGQPLAAAEAAMQGQNADAPENAETAPYAAERVTEPEQASQGEATAPASALSRIPVDEQGEPLLTHESVEAETAWDGAVEFFGNEEDALSYINARIKQSEATITTAEKAVGKIKPDGGMNKYRENLKNARAAVEAARTMQTRWQDIANIQQKRKEEAEAEVAAQKAFEESITKGKAELKQAYEEVKDVPEAVEILGNMEPQSIDEVAATVLSDNKVLWKDEGSKRGLKRIMGYGEGERRSLLGLFATTANGGMTLERLAEDRMQEMCREYGIAYDNQDALTALTDVIGACRTRADILKYIQNRRIEQAREVVRDYEQYLENEAERMSQEAYHMSTKEVEAYEEFLMAELAERDKVFAESDYNGYIADEMARQAALTNNQNGTESTDARRRSPSGNRTIKENVVAGESAVSGRGDEILPDPRANIPGGTAENAGQPGIQPGNGVQSNGSPSAVAQSSSGGVEANSAEKDENGIPFVLSENGTTSFGEIREESGLTAAPIKLSEGYQDEKGKGYGLRHIEAGHGEEIRSAGFQSVEEFVSYVATNYDEDNIRVGKQRRNGNTTYLIQVTDTHDNTLFIELSRDGSYWNVNSGGVFRKGYSNKKETVAKTEPQQPNNAVSSGSSLSADEQRGTSSVEPTGKPTVSADKGNALSTEKQGDSKKSSLQEQIAAAEAEVNTEPTPAQKEAGNYKKGHVQVGTFDVTIEQPAGSVRRGKDADGKEWETTMQNTYGYIRGTEGVDGDHIDVFLSTDIDAWDGRRVVIVDQYNPDGSFDEHKVMLGFNEKADAINAYLANYEKGWEKGRRLVFSTATLEDFEKWIESSHRKQKPYHEYKIAGKAEVDESTPENPVSATDYTIDAYTTKKNKTYHRVVFPRADKEVWQERLNLAKKMGGTSVPKGYGFKTRKEAEAFVKGVANPETIADAQPLSLEDMRSSIEEPAVTESKTATDRPVNPSGNKLVTDERYAELRERMRKKLGGQLNMGVDPEILAIGTEMAVYHIEKGARKFKAYASAMIADLGDAIRPYLKAFYNAVRDMPEAEAAGLVADMDSYEDVRSVDIANFDKPGTDAMATAAAVVAEQEAENQKLEAERKLQAYRHLVNKYAQDIANSPMFKKAVSINDSENVKGVGIDLYKYYVGEDIASIAENSLYQMFTDQWNADDGVLQSAILAEAIRKAHKVIQQDNTVVNSDGTTTETVVEGGTEIAVTTGDFIPGVKPTADNEKKPGGKKKPGKPKPKPATDGGLFDTVEDETASAPSIIVPEPRPSADLMGDSSAYQDRGAQTAELVEEIGGVIESRVMMLQLDAESVKPLTMTEVKKMASKYPALKDISDTDHQELVELAMTQLTRSEALVNIDGTAEQQRAAFDHIVNLYQIQPSLNARDSERLIKQQYSTPTPFGYVMGQFVRAGGKTVGSMLEPSAGNGALTITVHPSLVHVNDIDEARLANLRKLGYGQVTAQDALLPFAGDKVDVIMINPPFGTVAEKVYDGIFHVSSLEAQMAINALEQMKDDGRAAIVIGGNTSYRTNGSMNPKDAAFFGYLYSHYNVADVINISGKALYSRNGTGYDVRMILIDGRKTGEFQRVYPPVKAKARAEQVTTFDALYKRVQDDIQQIQQVGSQSADVQREPGAATDGTSSAPVRSGSNRPVGKPGTTGDAVRDTSKPDSGQPISGNVGQATSGVDNADGGNGTGINDVPRGDRPKPGQREQHNGVDNGRGRSGDDGRSTTASRPDGSRQRLAVKTGLGDEKVPYPNQSDNGFTLLSVVPAAQARVLQKSLGAIGDVDQFLVDELGYSSKDELYSYLAAEQIDSVALAIHQMNKGNAFIIGDMTGVGKGRQGAALIRYAVKQGKVPIYFTQKPTLFTDNYRDLVDIGSSDLRPFIMASVDKERSGDIVDANGKVVYKIPTKKEKERVYKFIIDNGKLPPEYDYVLSTYSQIQNGTADYAQNEDGTWNTEARKLPKKSKGYTTADYNGQTRRDALAKLAEGNIAILDESHTVGGDSGCGRYMQMLTSSASGVTFLSATFAKRADNMPIYAQRTAIAEAEVKASELIDAIMKGGVTLQEIMSKQLVESGQMIRRERSFEGVTIDWLSVEEETDRRQRQQFNEVADIFNAIRNFQDDYITPIIDAKNEAAAEHGATVGHTQGTKDLGVKNVPFASKMYNLVNQLLFALKVDAVADRVVENLRNGYKPVISFTNTMEGFLSSAPKGVVMDDVPNFSLTLMRALDGVMRFTEKDADENSEGGSISLSELSAEGQKAYNAIRDKIINLSADLPISPMDAIRMKIEEAGYSVAEITGRTMQLNRTDDGRYIVEARKDRDKKAAMRDFNSGKLDVLMINKSGSTGISLHASSKFEDQRPRVMVFAQFQSDINDEVQMRGRIDRSGQVTRGRYEYIMSTIPAEQRIQMMFKAKLKSLDANTTSSQKSKFNEMEIVDYLNKYGDDVVWEYMKEHPELEERLGDPLSMLQEKQEEDGPRTSEKEDTSKKTGCAGKISRYLAFLSVEEQDEIFREITEAYRVKIQLLDDAGENDLEITTMPLRAETKRKQIWHEGENPGSGNAFADNTYVEEVEVDVLKKPMKRAEIAEATRKLMGEHYTEKNGGVDWQHYARAKGDEISLFFQAKADEAVGKLKEAGEARIAKARERAVTAATKARGRGENNFTDEEIQSLADTVANEERNKEEQKQRKRQEEIMAIKHRLQSLLQRLRAGSIYVVPQDLKQGTAEMFSQTFGTFVGFKFNKGYTLGSSTAIFATLDSRRKVELALSDPAISTIISATEIAYRYSPKEINAITMENWDSNVPTQTRQKRYIITGNLLQALVDTEKGEKTRGNLISYSTIDGETRQGILMGENFKLTDLRNSATLSSRLAQIREGKAVVSENGDVQISKEIYDWRHRGEYELRVPKSKQRGGIYTMHPGLLKLVEGQNFITKGNNMVAYVTEENIANVVDMLSRAPFNLTVLQESQLSDVSADEAEDDVLCRPVTDKATLDRLNSEPTIKVYRAMQMIDGGLRPPMSGKVDGEWREATEVGIWEEAEEHPEMADEKGRFKLDKGNGKSIKAAYNPYIHTSRTPINDQFSSAWSRPELVIVEVEVPLSELTSGYRAEKAKDTVGEKEWKSGPVGRALAKIGQARRVILSRWSRIVRVVPVEEVAEAYAQRLNAHGIEVPFNTVPPALRDALAERGVKIGKPEKGNAGSASLPAFQQWINEQERQRMGDGYGAYSDAEVSLANDPISKVMGKNRFSKKRQAEFAARERQRMADRIKELAERMHLDNVEILTDASQLEGKRAKAKGFYNKRTGKITIVLSNHVSSVDAELTLLHEAVGHYGLRQLFGAQFNTFLDNVYESADEGIRRRISEMAAKNGWDFRTATEEYLAGLAEDKEFEAIRHDSTFSTWFHRVKSLFLDMLEKIGFEGFRDRTGIVLTDNELRYILWRSYMNLAEPGLYRSILGEAADVAKQAELKVGNYAPTAAEVAMASESTTTELFNDIFNEQLDGYISGKLSSQEYLNVGMPQGIMRHFLPELPIVMRQRILSKASETKHNVALTSLKDLPSRISKPIFIFQRNAQTIGILTEIKDRDDKNVCVAIELNRTIQKGGEVLEVNDVRSIHGRDAENIVLPIVHNNTLRYVDKKKGLAWLSSASSNYQQEIASQDLETVAKIVKEFENPAIEDENYLLFRTSGSARDEYDERVRTKIVDKKGLKSKGTNRAAQLNEAYLDGMRSLRVLQEAVSHETGKPVQDFENAYMAENHMSSRNKIHEEAFQRDYFEPMCKAVADVCKGKNEAYRELLDYIIAKHGLERNAYMRAKAVADGMEQGVADATDFSGLTALTGEANVTDAEAKAEQMVSDYETSHDTAELWNRINAATAETLRIRYQGGLLSKDVYEQIRGMYNNYIPLKGWDETTAIDVYEYASGGYGLSSALMAAHGRRSLADDPLSTIMTDAQRTIMEANRNIMKQKLLNLALNHQTDLLSISRQWYIKQPDGTWLPDNPVIPEDVDADTVDAIVKAHEAQMLTLEAQGDAKSKRAGLKLGVVKGNADTDQHVVKVKRNGETYCIYVNGDPRAARAINGMLLKPDFGDEWKWARVVKNFMAKAFTTWNPEFIVGNLSRDVMFAGTAVAIKEDEKYVRRYTGNITAILAKAKLPRLLYKWEHGTLDVSIEEERYFKEFLMNGGETGYTQLNTVEQAKKDMARFLREARGGASSVSKKAWRGFWRGVEFMNRSAEDTTRFAVYMTSRQQGRSVSRSISDAKEITVNFNRKGSGAWGARYMNFLYVFFNACMQSAANMGRLVSRHKGKAAIAAGVFLSSGFLVPMLSCLIGALTGDGDDDDEYWKLSEWERRNNICLRIPFTKRHLMIPIAHELRPIYGIGEIAYSTMCGKETIEDGIWKGIEGFGGMLPVDPTGNGGNNVVTFSPTIAQPLVQVYENVNYFGKPIYRDTPWNKDDPEWTKAYKGTNGLLVDLSRMLSEAGSTTDKYGVVSYPKHWYTGDINPTIVEHLLESYTGGLGKTVNGFGKTISMLWNEDARTLRNVPVARKFLRQSDERAETYKFNNDYFKIKEEYDESKKYLRKLGTLDNDSIMGVADRVTRWLDSEKGQRYEMMNDYFKELNSYSRAINNEEDEQTLSEMQHDVDSIKRELVQKVDSIKSSQVRK